MANEYLYTFQCKKCGHTIQVPGQWSPEPRPVGKCQDGTDHDYRKIDSQKNG